MAEPTTGVAPQGNPDPNPGGSPTPPPAGSAQPPPAGSAQPPAGDSPQPAGGTPPAAQPFASFPDAESFNKRIEREARKQLKEMGIEDPDEVKRILKEHQEAERAQMSENERLKADLAAANEAKTAAEARAEDLRVRNHRAGVFAKKGITNYDYGHFLIDQELKKLGDGGELDEDAFLDKLIGDKASAAALGIAPPPAAPSAGDQPPAAPADTSPTAPGATPTPPGANPSIPPKSAMDLSPEEWGRRKQELGLPT